MTTDRSLQAREAAVLTVLIAVGAGLRFYKLNTDLWYDEIVTLLQSVRHPLVEIITHFPGNNDHPLYSVLARVSVVVFGEEPWSLRLPSAVFGIAAIPVLYVTGTAVTNRLEAGAAALMLTVSYHHIWFSQNARGYTALLFFVLIATFALIRWFDTGRRSFLVAYAAAMALGSYAHLTLVPVCLSHALVCVWAWATQGRQARVRAEWKALAAAFVGSGLLTVLLYGPMLLDVGVFFATQTASENEVATPLWAMAAAVTGLQVGFGTLWAIGLGGLVFCAGAGSYFKQRSTVALLFLVPLPGTVLLALMTNRPIFPRFAFFAVGFCLLMIVRGAAAAGRLMARATLGRVSPQQAATWMIALVTLGAVALSVRSWPYGYRYPKQDYAGAVNFVEQTKNADDRVAVVGATGAIPVLNYLGKPWQRVGAADPLRQLRNEGNRVWVIYTFPSYMDPDLWKILHTECAQVGEFEGTVGGGSITVRRCP